MRVILLDIKEVYTAINSDQRVRQLVKTAPLNIIERIQVKHFDSKQFILHQGGAVPVYLSTGQGAGQGFP